MNSTKPKKIFVVDDDPMLTESLKDYLTREVAHDVSVFHTGEECVKHLAEAPDAIVLDYYLNTVQKDAANGMQVLQTIKKHHPLMQVIMLSSQENYSIALRTIAGGALQYVTKDENAFEKIASMIND